MSTAVLPAEAPWRAGLRSARANLLPGFVLQITALALVTAYYQHDGTRALLGRLAAWRTEVGIASAVLTTGLFGGLLPVLYLRARRATRAQYTWRQGLAITLFWAYKGAEVEILYRLLARYVGEGHDVATIAIKTSIDQFVYCPLLAVPFTALMYEWTTAHFRGSVVAEDFRAGRWIRRRVVPVLISNIGVWLPAACIIYSLPTPLQLPLQNLVLCFFTLLVAHQTKRSAEHESLA
ncbi:hypothetical protein [Opitutus terrae]|uniref:Uncharacterized protein n=1 Tax=Opitutus terrae (strain DSM 11246 / JCM 15787 / PB90-1) TaxID=452637 RepID=B1ZWQ7_OPITP|nr:hypothetical protein [Opitutus terrae]ACB74184.1 conserved hypothetical protein [Opitutus terrae PB90-1]